MKPSRLVIFCLFWTSPAVVAKTLGCDALFGFESALRAQGAAARIIAADEDESVAYGFVGISDEQLLRLVNTGKLKTPLKLRVTTDHPAFAHLKVTPVDWRTASRRAVQDARVQSALTVLESRNRLAETRRLAAVLEHLVPPPNASAYSPSFAQIESAAVAARLVNLGRGEDAKLRRLALMLGAPSTAEPGPAVVAALTNLPAGAGARLAVSERLASRISFADGAWFVSSIDIQDVIAIRPNSSATNDFLESLGERAVAATHPEAEEGT